MGRAALLLVFGSILAVGYSQMTSNQSMLKSETEEASYEQKVLAREIARSGFNLIVSRVKADFANHRGNWEDNAYGDGTYDIEATGSSGGPVDIVSIGYFGGFEHEISAEATQESSRVLDATTIASDELKFEPKDDILISGIDTNPDGSPGSAEDTHAVIIPDGLAWDQAMEKVGDVAASQITGAGTDPDVVNTSPVASLSTILAELEAASGADVYDYSGDIKIEDGLTMGSASSPVLMRVEGKVEIKENGAGYGVILSKELVKMEKNARWEGLIFVVGDQAKFEMKDESELYGAVIVQALLQYTEDNDDGGLPGGHFDVDVFEAPDWDSKIYHQHQYDDKFDVTGVDLLNPTGCGSQGLCWDDVMPSQKAAFVEFFNENSSDGTYSIEADASSGPAGVPAVSLSGNPRDGLSPTLFDASEITNFTVNFSQLCVLEPTSPGNVQKNPSTRAGGFSVRIYDADGPMGGPYTQGDMVYELSIYHHDSGGEKCEPSEGGETEVLYTPGEKAEFKMSHTARLQYSASALSAAASLYAPTADPGDGVIKLSGIYETTRVQTP